MATTSYCSTLSNTDISRYSRQLILPEWGVTAQECVKSLSVLIVGAGGLGCPAAQYLSAAGVGHIGILDFDTVEMSNLHRQILHNESKVGMAKVDSIRDSISKLNSSIKVSTHQVLLSSNNAMDIMNQYDIIVDASDNVATRYLINDGCVLLDKPLVSGSALRFEGQLTVYHHGKDGPCYRCVFPSPPPPNMVTNCSEGGVLGVIPGIIGSLQALEVLKIATNNGGASIQHVNHNYIDVTMMIETYNGRLLLYDGLAGMFRTIKLRGRNPSCSVCGDNPTITKLIDYELFCGSSANDKDKPLSVLDNRDRITCQEYKGLLDDGDKHILIDVRPTVEFEICHLDNAINVPLKSLDCSTSGKPNHEFNEIIGPSVTDNVPIYVVCRRGNDSQLAVGIIKGILSECCCNVPVKDIIGGLTHWSEHVDQQFPKY